MQNVKAALILSVFALTVGVASAVPQSPAEVTDDTEIYQNLSEIKASKKKEMHFHQDLTRLMAIESRFHERLPRTSGRIDPLQNPLKRIQKKKYIFQGSRKAARSQRVARAGN